MFELADEMSNYSIDDVESAIEILETPIEKQLRHEYIRMAFQEKKYLKLDAMDNKYKRQTEADYEEIRKNSLKKLKGMNDPIEKLDYMLKTAEEISDAVYHLQYNEIYKNGCYIAFAIQVCKNMLEAGVSLTEIVKYVPRTSISDIYHLGERYLGIDVNVSDEELKLIEEEDKSKN